MTDGKLAFGPFMLDAARGALLRNSAPVAVGQRALAVLAALAETPGRTIAKEDLLARAWPGTIVEEGNLTVQIAALRKALGATDGGREWIVTVPRVGYRLVAPTSPAAAVATTPTLPRLAVLPFTDLSGDPQRARLAEGIVEDIITALSQLGGLAVVARSSCLAYRGRTLDVRQVAAELDARYLLEGSVRRSGDRLRITAQLVDGDTGAQLWGRHFDSGLRDDLDVQDGITAAIVSVVESRIEVAEIERSRRLRPDSAAAYDLYLRSLREVYRETARENAEAYARLTEALRADPDNSRLLAQAARALEHRTAMGWPPLSDDDARACGDLARRGLHRAAGDAVVVANCGLALLQGAKEYDLGLAILRSAAKANPDDITTLYSAGIAHLHCGTLEEALTCFHRAHDLNPRDPTAHISLCGIAHAHILLGDFAEARDWATRALSLVPFHNCSLWMLVAANMHLGRLDEARSALSELRKFAPEVTVASIRAGQPARDPNRIEPILAGLRLAGLPEE